MTADDYKSVDTIKGALGSIARLGRAAGVHLALAMQRASGGTVSSDLMNNIQQSILLGAFDSGSSTLMFEKDITNLAKPDIKGRGFMQVGKKEIYEVQTYWIEPENVWVFDEEQRLTYDNAVYLEQCRRLGKEPDMSGFVVPSLVSNDSVDDNKAESINENQDIDNDDNIWDDFDDWDDEDNNDDSLETLSTDIEEASHTIESIDPILGSMENEVSETLTTEASLEPKPKRFKLKL